MSNTPQDLQAEVTVGPLGWASDGHATFQAMLPPKCFEGLSFYFDNLTLQPAWPQKLRFEPLY